MAVLGRRGRPWVQRAVVGTLCVLGVVAMQSGTDHLGGMGASGLTPSGFGTEHDHHTSGHPGNAGQPGHESEQGAHHSAHLMVVCLLVVTAVAATIHRRWQRRGSAPTPSAPPASAGVRTLSRPPNAFLPWQHDRLCVQLR